MNNIPDFVLIIFAGLIGLLIGISIILCVYMASELFKDGRRNRKRRDRIRKIMREHKLMIKTIISGNDNINQKE